MGREVRRIAQGWEHPRDERGEYRPLLKLYGQTFEELLAEWDRDNVLWLAGEHPDQLHSEAARACADFEEWHGSRPRREQYMPFWTESEATKLVMYEDTSEGTPISPAFDTPEELARWLADNNASAFGPQGASYEEWLSVCGGSSSAGLIVNQATGEMRPDFVRAKR